jgi:hypothetical protein
LADFGLKSQLLYKQLPREVAEPHLLEASEGPSGSRHTRLCGECRLSMRPWKRSSDDLLWGTTLLDEPGPALIPTLFAT